MNKDKLGVGYQKMMLRVAEILKKVDKKLPPIVHEAIEKARQKSVELGELNQEESEKVAEYLRRDLDDASGYVSKTGKELKDWLSFDTLLIEKELWELFSSVADKTILELLQFKASLPPKQYITHQIVGMGGLKCLGCGEVLQFYRPTAIPPCPQCQGTVFERNRAKHD